MSAAGQAQSINEDKMNAFLGKVVGDFGASLSSALVYIGQKLGLYKAMSEAGPLTPAELAQRTNTSERYVREWLINQAAGGYAEYDSESGRYSLTPEQAVAIDGRSKPFLCRRRLLRPLSHGRSRLAHARIIFALAAECFGVSMIRIYLLALKSFPSGVFGHLIATWIPSLTGIEEKAKDRRQGC